MEEELPWAGACAARVPLVTGPHGGGRTLLPRLGWRRCSCTGLESQHLGSVEGGPPRPFPTELWGRASFVSIRSTET